MKRELIRISIFIVTAGLLVATSKSSNPCEIAHPEKSRTFHIEGECGPSGDFEVTLLEDSCDVTTNGEHLGVPRSGRSYGADDPLGGWRLEEVPLDAGWAARTCESSLLDGGLTVKCQDTPGCRWWLEDGGTDQVCVEEYRSCTSIAVPVAP